MCSAKTEKKEISCKLFVIVYQTVNPSIPYLLRDRLKPPGGYYGYGLFNGYP